MTGVILEFILGTLAAGVTEPYALITCEPEAEAGTIKAALQPPWRLAVIPWATVAPSTVTVMPVSPAPKPEPLIVTEVPAAPLARLIDMPGVAVKFRLETAFGVTEPYALIKCEPEAEAGTPKVTLQPPWASAVTPWATGVPS
jgi:hypothetical protein